MTQPQPTPDRPDMAVGYGINQQGETLPWSWAEQRLAEARNYWVATTRADGRPHVMPVWGLWHQGAFYFGTDRTSVKGRNLAANPAVVVHLESGDEAVILEGRAAEAAAARLPELDALYLAKYQFPLTGAPGEALVYCVRPTTAFGWLESDFPNAATRWRFP